MRSGRLTAAIRGNKSKLIFLAGFFICGFGLLIYSVFTPPLTGLTDQNDFWRLQYGMENMDEADFHATQKYRFVVTEYRFTPFPHGKLVFMPPGDSPVYFIYAARIICKILGFPTFRMSVLCLLSGGVYILLLTGLYGLLMPAATLKRLLLGLLLLFIFCDSTYLTWFYSLYAEPYFMIGFAAVAVAFLWALKNLSSLGIRHILSLIAACAFLLGSKTQILTLYPVCAVLIAAVWFFARKQTGRNHHFTLKSILLWSSLPLLLVYCFTLYTANGSRFTKETLYHSVMFGLLTQTDHPENVLDDWGLDPALIGDVGKDSYQPPDQYVFGSPYSEAMQVEFFNKVSRGTVVRHYLTHPKDLWRAMSYTASSALHSDTWLRKHTGEYPVFIRESHKGRFSLWASFRFSLPKQLWFLLLVFGISAGCFLWAPFPRGCRLFFCCVLAAGVIQFAMPYVLNGAADTYKQLFPFTFIFDSIAAVLICTAANALTEVLHGKMVGSHTVRAA